MVIYVIVSILSHAKIHKVREYEPEHCVADRSPNVTNLSWLIFSEKLRMKCLKSGNRCGALAGVLKYSTRTSVS